MIKGKYLATLAAAGLFALGPAMGQSDPGTQGPGSTPGSGQGQTAPTDQSGRSTRSHRKSQSSDQGSATSAESKNTNKKSSASMDQKFVEKATEGDLAEIQLGNLAQRKASNDAVKQFGQQLVQDHTKSSEQLKQIAQNKGLNVPAQLDSKHQTEYDRLSRLSGAEFDRAFARYETRDHKKDISEFKKESKKGTDPEVKSFAGQQISGLQHHLQMAQQLEASTGATASRSNSTSDMNNGPETGRTPRTDDSGMNPNNRPGSSTYPGTPSDRPPRH